ncbi:MAG: fold metallo-hydrolase [Acidobacteriota bacterium]|nr:fold metallo-hydrolase [Acidobacteriota bacterium]
MIKVCSLSSGSNGNAIYIKTGANCFLVDAGISCKQICLRLHQIESHISHIKGIFITHEHSDHIRGLEVLLKKHPTPVYLTQETYRNMPITIDETLLHFISANDRIIIDETVIQSLPKSHDAVEPLLFCFYYKGKKISVITDAGYGCDNVIAALREAHIIFLESNYDEEMLQSGFYPPYLKKRIAGPSGHLSNVNAGTLIRDHASPYLEYIFLSHLSENNNTPRLALETFLSIVKERNDLEKLNTILTSRYHVSDVVEIKVAI